MPSNCFNQRVLASSVRLGLPIATYPGLALTGATVREAVNNPQVQFDAVAALHARYRTPFVLSAMDLSAEAEAFGCALHVSDNEIPSVTGRLVASLEQARKLAAPQPGDRRTAVYLETVRRLKKLPSRPMVLAGCIGPFSLAARLVGVSEALELTLAEPGLMGVVLEKSAAFLTGYARAFKDAGADGLIMAEPAAGLLSPRGVSAFSSPYIKGIAAEVCDGHFALILHNCAARLLHLPAILETGLTTFHFGAPMDLPAALGKVAPDVVLCGNLDPTGVFCQLAPAEVTARAADLLSHTAAHRNYVLSSGCDVPAGAPLASLDAFYAALKGSPVSQ
jgi:uroporphyrinogen decarboxylase